MVRTKAPLQLLVTNLDYDEHKGRICIGRITSGKISKGESVAIAKPGAPILPEPSTSMNDAYLSIQGCLRCAFSFFTVTRRKCDPVHAFHYLHV